MTHHRVDVIAALSLVGLFAGCERAARPAPGDPSTPPPPATAPTVPTATPIPPGASVTPPPPVPGAALGWKDAARIRVSDGWGGLGCSYRFEVELERKGGRFVGQATIDVRGKAVRPVDLAVEDVAKLEAAATTALARDRSPPRDPGLVQVQWTDDYPSGAITFDGPRGKTRLFYVDQRRQLQLERGAEVVPLDRPFEIGRDQRRPMWDAYQAFLDGPLGARAWIEEQCGGPP